MTTDDTTTRGSNRFLDNLRNLGPGLLVAAAFLGPGTITTACKPRRCKRSGRTTCRPSGRCQVRGSTPSHRSGLGGLVTLAVLTTAAAVFFQEAYADLSSTTMRTTWGAVGAAQ